MPLPTVWFNKSFSPTLHQIRALRGHARTLASHTSADSIMLLEADEAFLEPKGLMGDDYVAYCLDLCRERGVNVLIPHKEMLVLAGRQQEFEAAGVQLVVAGEPATLDLLDDKARFGATLPPHIGRVPETVTVQTWPQMRAAIDDLRTRHKGVCVKPARGIYGFGFRVLTREPELKRFLDGDLYVMSEGQAEALFAPQPELPPLLVMELLPGVERSVDCVAWRGELAGAVVRKKVGGLGNVQELEDHPELLGVARALTAHYGLSGLFNIQFKEDLHGRPVVLEINPRASGGLRTSLASGLNFPLAAVQLALGQIRPDQVAPGRTGLRLTELKDVVELRDHQLRDHAPA